MAKDPAFLFYPGDWLGGTMHLDFESKGAYMELLMLQFQRGHMTLDMIGQVLGQRFGQIWPKIKDKFRTDGAVYWNERLKIEKQNRIDYVNSRKNNKKGTNQHTKKEDKKRGHTTKHTTGRMEDEDENVNELKNKKESPPDFTKPDAPGDEIIFPFDTAPMRQLWASWKEARWATHGVRYPMHGEQADLRRMRGMTFQQIEYTIQQAIAAGWKNLYPEKNGTTKQRGSDKNSARGADAILKRGEDYGEL